MEPHRMPRALVVDDSRDFRALLARALQKENINCDVAADGLAADYLLETHQYDIVLTDLRMPRKHGHQLILEILDQQNPPMVVAMTGVMEPRLVADLISRGVVDVIQKPLAFDVIAAKVKALLARHVSQKPQGVMDGASKVAEGLGKATEAMRAQLVEVTSSFEAAIRDLEQQKKEIEEGFHGSLRVLTNLFDRTEATSGSHAGRVEKLAADIADRIGIKGNERRNLVYAALLHDVGQFGMPDAIRTKPPWTLTDSEREVFRGYPVIGAMLLSEVRGAEKVAEIVEAHAERFDGSGFPNGLRGDKIPLSARVIRIADGCDTHLMFGNHEHPIEEVRKHLLALRGRHYDPDLVDVAIASATQAYTRPAEEDMIQVPIDKADAGLILAENVYDSEGRFLARQGATLSAGMLLRLRWLLVNQVIKVHRPAHEPE